MRDQRKVKLEGMQVKCLGDRLVFSTKIGRFHFLYKCHRNVYERTLVCWDVELMWAQWIGIVSVRLAVSY